MRYKDSVRAYKNGFSCLAHGKLAKHFVDFVEFYRSCKNADEVSLAVISWAGDIIANGAVSLKVDVRNVELLLVIHDCSEKWL